MLEAGKLNRRITIQQRNPARDASGTITGTWQDVVQVWAWVKTQTGMSALRGGNADGVSMSITGYSFRIRFRLGVTDAMRVLYSGRAYDIKQVRHDLAGRAWTDIVCEEGGNDG